MESLFLSVTTVQAEQEKIVRLEAARGIASIIVFFGHFLLAFEPHFMDEKLVGRWFFFLFNGTAAVSFFFVLSGYVLCIKPLRTKDLQQIKISLIRRWPRLVPLVLASVLISWCIYAVGGYVFHDVAALNGSHWHKNWSLDANAPTLLDAVIQGVFMAFFADQNYLNTNLWTMGKELQGSLYVFALAALMLVRRKHFSLSVLFLVSLLAGLSNALLPFLFGFLLAFWRAEHGNFKLGLTTRLLALVLGLYLLGYRSADRDFSWITLLDQSLPFIDDLCSRLLLPLGSLLILISLLSGPVFRWLDGPVGRWLGELSFPFYVIHTIILLSFSSWLYLHAEWPIWMNFTITFCVIILSCLPLMRMDEAWVRWLKMKTSR